MTTRKASASWDGDWKSGKGAMKPDHAAEVPFSAGSRLQADGGSGPEEMIGAALAGCYSMALSHALEQAGTKPESVQTTATLHFESTKDGLTVPRIDLVTEVKAAGADAAKFAAIAEDTKNTCLVAKLLTAQVVLTAKLV